MYGIMYLKWRIDSLKAALKAKNYLDVFLCLAGVFVILAFRENIFYYLLGQVLISYYSAFVLSGNHEHEQRFP